MPLQSSTGRDRFTGDRRPIQRTRMGTRVFHLSQDVNWVIRVWPQPHVMASMDTEVDVIALIVGLLSSALLVIATYLAQTSRLRAWEIAVSNQNLQREMDERRRASCSSPGAKKKSMLPQLPPWIAYDSHCVVRKNQRNLSVARCSIHCVLQR